MVRLKLRIEKEHQNFVLLNFFIPYLKTLENSIHFFNRKNDHLFLKINGTVDKEVFEKNLKKQWTLFLEKNQQIIDSIKVEKVENLFMQLPLGNIKILENNEDSGESTFNLTKANLEILDFLENQKEKYDEYLINLFLIFLYTMGGYSPKKIQELSKYFLESINFDEYTKSLLNEQVGFLIAETGEPLESHIKNIHSELSSFYTKDEYPSLISKWKYEYKESYKSIEKSLNKDTGYLFKQFKNQLNISDSESYVLLSLMNNFFKN